MTDKIIHFNRLDTLRDILESTKKKVVIAGGCFDILHIGHISFLEAAKKQGEILVVLLESDDLIRKMKGEGRPINTQEDRAAVLAALSLVDYIVLLPHLLDNSQYDELIFSLKPAIIATTKADPARMHKERQAQALGISVVDVIDRIENQSTSKIASVL